jgi:hypothetical protein
MTSEVILQMPASELASRRSELFTRLQRERQCV